MKIASARAADWATVAHRRLHLALVERIALERDDAAAAARDRLLECRLDHGAIGVVRHERGERPFALARGVADDALDVGSRAGSSAGRRRAPRHWRRSRRRSPARCASARAGRPAPTVCANSGPRMISAPSSSTCCAACWAPGALPPSSFTRSWISGLLNSASAISAALRIDCAATPALPLADSGRMSPTLTLPCADTGRRLRRRRRLRAGNEIAGAKNCPSTPASRAAGCKRGEPGGQCSRAAERSAPAMLGTWAVSSTRPARL